MKNKNIVIIGGAGFLGNHLSNYLVQENNVLVLDNLLSGKREYLDSNVNFRKIDIRYSVVRLSKILRDFKTDYVFHLAACPFIPDSYENPEEFVDINIRGTLNVLKACQEADIYRVLVYSSSEVYGGASNRHQTISEDFPVFPRSLYATTKLAADRICYNFFNEHGVPVIILRQFNSFGPKWTQPYVIPVIMKQLSIRETIKLGNIRACRDFLYVKDQVRIVSELIEKGKVGEVYNLGLGKSYSVKEIAVLIAKIMGKVLQIEVREERMRPDDVQYLLSDNTKVYKVIKSRPEYTFEEGLKETYQWFLNRK